MTRLARPAIAAVLVLGMSLLLVPLATRVWTTEIVPAANRIHFGDGLIAALALAGFALYLLTSVLFVHRRPISPVGSAAGCTVSSRPGTTTAVAVPRGAAADGPGASVPARPAPRPAEGRATGRGVTPGGAA